MTPALTRPLPAALATVPVFRPDITEAEIAAAVDTLRSGWIGAGPRAAELERRFAAMTGARHAVAVASGSAALLCALHALGVGEGDEVILPSFTWVSAFQALRAIGAVPVFADIEPEHLTLDPAEAQRLIGPRTRGILAVHHGGQLADVEALNQVARAHGLWLLDDAAHACGAAWGERPVGALTDVTCFSFNAMKNLATPEGGLLTTDDDALADHARHYRALGIDRDTFARYGQRQTQARWVYDVVGEGQRLQLNDVCAAIALVQLQRLPELNACRGQLVARYRAAFAGDARLRPVGPRPRTRPSHHMFTLRLAGRDRFVEAMAERGIQVGVHYIPVHLFTAARPWHRDLPVTEAVWREVATLPLYPGMTADEQDRVIEATLALAGAG